MFLWPLLKSNIGKEVKRFLTQRDQQRRGHGLDAPSPSAGDTNQQGFILTVHVLRLFSPTNGHTKCYEQEGISKMCDYQEMSHTVLLNNHRKLQELSVFQMKMQQPISLKTSHNKNSFFRKFPGFWSVFQSVANYLQASSSGLAHLWSPAGHGSSHCTLQSSSSLHDI